MSNGVWNGVRWSRGFAVGSAAALALLTLTATPAEAQKGKAKGDAARYAQLDAFVAQAIKEWKVPGVALAIGMAVGGVVLSFVVPRIVLAGGGTPGNENKPQADGRFAAEFSASPHAAGGTDFPHDDSPAMLAAAGKVQTAAIIGSACQ